MKLLLLLLLGSVAFGQSLASQDCSVKQYHYPEQLQSVCVFTVSQPSALAKIFLLRRSVTEVTLSFADRVDWTIRHDPDMPNQFSAGNSNPNRNITAVTINGRRYATVYK